MKAIFIFVLAQRKKRLGVLVAEYLGEQPADWQDKIQRIDIALRTSVPLFAKARQLHSIPLLGSASWLFDVVLARPLRTSFVALLIASLLVAAWIALVTTNAPFEIRARGVLVPSYSRQVFASAKGSIQQVLVQEGDIVQLDQDVAVLESIELQEKIKKTEGELDEFRQQLDVLKIAEMSDARPANSDELQKLEVRQVQLAAEIKRAQIRIATLQETLASLQKQQTSLTVKSPLAGEVTSRKIETALLDRPVDRGDPLLTIADLNAEWEIQLEVSESKIGYVIEALNKAQEGSSDVQVQIKLSSDPTLNLYGTVREVDFITRAADATDSADATIRVTVDIDEKEFDNLLRIGTGVDGKITCGERNYLFLLTYEIRDKIRKTFFF